MLGPTKAVSFIGIDVDGLTCYIAASDEDGRCVLRRRVSRAALLMEVPTASGASIGLEYRSDIHGLATCLADMGHEVRLIRSRDIPTLNASEKREAFDFAEALCDVVRQGATEAVPVLKPDQHGREASQRVKALLKRQRSAVLNSARNVIGDVDAGQRPTKQDDVEIMCRLGSIARTSAFHSVSSALSQVLSSLESTIAMLDDVESTFEARLNEVTSGVELQGNDAPPEARPPRASVGHTRSHLARTGLAFDLSG